MNNSGSIEIDRLVEEVFEYTNKNVAEWSITVVEDEVIDQRPEEVGTTFRCVTEERGTQMVFQGVVTHYDSPKFSAVHLTGPQFDIVAEYTFEDLGGRTRVTQHSEVKPKGLIMKAFFLCCGWIMRKASCDALDKELASLKKHLEDGAGQPR